MSRAGYETNPLRVGAPLPEGLAELALPSESEIRAELTRAEVELMHAIAQHRKAWSAMRRRAKEREELAGRPGRLAYLESDSLWKTRTGAVSWWCGEMQAQAALVQTLQAMLYRRLAAGDEADGPWVTLEDRVTKRPE